MTFANVRRMWSPRSKAIHEKHRYAPIVSGSRYARLTSPLTIGEECMSPTGGVFSLRRDGFYLMDALRGRSMVSVTGERDVHRVYPAGRQNA